MVDKILFIIFSNFLAILAKSKSFSSRHLLNNGSVYIAQLLWPMRIGLFKFEFKSKSRLPISECTGYHCNFFYYCYYLAKIRKMAVRVYLYYIIIVFF